jgi:MerR family transcriptional regulator, light-induced transcriptional regulator
MEQFISPKLVAQAIGVSESSIKRWCDRGLLQTVRTAGGHRRMTMNSVVEFIRSTGQLLVEPQLLGLPADTGRGETSLLRSRDQLTQALIEGDETRARKLVFDLYMAATPAVEIFDKLLAPTMHAIGERWAQNSIEVYQERRACEIVLRILFELRTILPVVRADAPYAMGGTLSKDPYKLATTMVELVLREAGWRAESYGTDLPLCTLGAAAIHMQPRLCWMSVSCIEDVPKFQAEYARFAELALNSGIAIVVGGRALTEAIRREMNYSAYCDTFRHIVQFAGAIYRPIVNTSIARTSEPTSHSEVPAAFPSRDILSAN